MLGNERKECPTIWNFKVLFLLLTWIGRTILNMSPRLMEALKHFNMSPGLMEALKHFNMSPRLMEVLKHFLVGLSK